MDLGRVICQARKASCSICPLKKDCFAYKNGKPESFAMTIAKKSSAEHILVLLRIVVKEKNKYLFYQKTQDQWLSGQWELPTFIIDSSDKNLKQYPSIKWNKNIDKHFKELKKNNAGLFDWSRFVASKWGAFKNKWSTVITSSQLDLAEYIVSNFSTIQEKLSDKNLTFCHGDVKSANIFYKKLAGRSYEPYFIDWQYISLGKGVQDLVFFMIESFDIEHMRIYKSLFKDYYYVKMLEAGIKYDRSDYDADFINASYYFPFFVAIWFGTLSEDELIDKQFPHQFIQKLFSFYELDH